MPSYQPYNSEHALRYSLQLLGDLGQRYGLSSNQVQALERLLATLPDANTQAQRSETASTSPSGHALGQALRSAEALLDQEASTRQGPFQEWVDRARKAVMGIGADIRRQQASRMRGLYVIADPGILRGRDLRWIVEGALKGGACAIQLREKDRDKGDVLPLAREIAALCRHYEALFFVNDHADLAMAAGADGVHVGQHDLPVPEVRAMLGPFSLVGTSNALVPEVEASAKAGADYIAVGAMFATTTKSNTRPAGVETLRLARNVANTPLVAIGGINVSNAAQVMEAGADALCVTSAVVGAEDPEAAAAQLVEIIQTNLARLSRR